MIRLFTFGGLAVRKDSGRDSAIALAHVKRNALLTYLAVERPNGSHSRDTLLALFWPESDDQHARDALNQLLHSLRRDLRDDVFTSGSGHGIALDEAVVWCDAVELQSAASRGEHTAAFELYRGDFLAGFNLSNAPEFEEWLARQRERLRELAATVGKLKAEAEEQSGDPDASIHSIRRVLELKPFDESSFRSLLRLYIAAGENGQAVAEYEAYTERLANELDASPAAETVALVERARTPVIVREEPTVVVMDPPAATADPVVARGHPPKRRVAAAGILAAVIAALAFAVTLATRPEAPTLQQNRILVDLFENQTGDPGLDHLSRLATDHVTAGLTFTTFADVVTFGTSLLSRRGAPIAPDSEAADVAVARGAGTLVRGTYMLSGDSIRFDAQLVDVQTGTVIAPVPSVSSLRGEVTHALEGLRDRVMAAIGAHVDPRLADWSRHSSRPPTFAIYKTFVEGLEAHTNLGRRSAREGASLALPLFLDAFEADSTFTMAAIWAVMAAVNSGNWQVQDSILNSLVRRQRTLADLDRLMVEYFTAESPEQELEVSRRLVAIAPGSDYLKLAALAARKAARPEEALEYYRAADPTSGWLYGWRPFWYSFANNLDEVGQCDEIPRLAERAGRTLSQWGVRVEYRLDLRGYACIGDTERLMEVAERYLLHDRREGRDARTTAGPLRLAVLELVTHGPLSTDAAPFVDLVEHYLIENIDAHDQIAEHLADVLASTGRLDSARVVLERAGRPPRPMLTAVLDIRAGRYDRIEELIAKEREIGEFNGLAAEAALAAHLGDMDRAMKAAAEAVQLTWWWGASQLDLHQTPWLYGPLLEHPPFQELIAPRG